MHCQRFILPTALVALVLSTIPAGASAGSDRFGWTLVSGKSQSNMGDVSPNRINELRHRYGRRFLAIQDGDEMYVITDKALVRRGEDTTMVIHEYQPDIADMAQAEAQLSLSEQNHEDEKAELRARRKEIRKSIDDNERRGRSTEDLEQELFQADVQLQAIRGIEESSRLTDQEKRKLTRQRDKASVKVKVGTDRINRGMRELLEDAKGAGKAERVR